MNFYTLQNPEEDIPPAGSVKDNHIQFLESPCRDKLCVKAGILKNSPLICMPNGIIIRFENNFDKDTEIDSIVW